MDREWAELLNGENVNFELRLRRPFVAEKIVGGQKMEGLTWIVAAAYPEKADDGSVVGLLGCIYQPSEVGRGIPAKEDDGGH